MEKIILTWHCHHDTLVEQCYDFNARCRHIRMLKPPDEWARRLRLFKPVKETELPEKVMDALDELNKRIEELNKLVQEHGDVSLLHTKEAIAYWGHREAIEGSRKKLHLAVKAEMDFFKKLHKIECPNCPWNGRTIFPSDIPF